MVEGQNNQGANPAIEWPRGIEPDMLQSLLEENSQEGAKLRNVVSRALVSESDSLSHPFGSNPPPSIEGFIIVASQLRDVGDFVDRYKDRAVEEITEDFSEQRSGSTLDNLRFLETILSRYQQLVPPGIDFDEPSGLPRHLIETMQRAEILKRDQTGFELVDYLAEQNSYQPDHSDFEQERRGRTEAARRYKELYNRLLESGATSD